MSFQSLNPSRLQPHSKFSVFITVSFVFVWKIAKMASDFVNSTWDMAYSCNCLSFTEDHHKLWAYFTPADVRMEQKEVINMIIMLLTVNWMHNEARTVLDKSKNFIPWFTQTDFTLVIKVISLYSCIRLQSNKCNWNILLHSRIKFVWVTIVGMTISHLSITSADGNEFSN